MTNQALKKTTTNHMKTTQKLSKLLLAGLLLAALSYQSSKTEEEDTMLRNLQSEEDDGFSLAGITPHEHGAIIVWTLVADTLIVCGKYMKTFRRSWDVHAWGFVVVTIFTMFIDEFAPQEQGEERRVLRRMLKFKKQMSENERMLMISFANADFHITLGFWIMYLTIFMVFEGLVLRFAIACQGRYKFLQFVNSFDLTWQRWVHCARNRCLDHGEVDAAFGD